MSIETVFTNGRLVLRDRVIEGTLVAVDGAIRAIDSGSSRAGGVDLAGDFLIPGLIELHTDRLESHLAPRPGVRWPTRAALVAHDQEVVAAGITTVFDSVACGSIDAGSLRREALAATVGALHDAGGRGMLLADHRLHLRCEVACADVVDLFDGHADDPLLALVSLMDHTPGQRQFAKIEKYREYYQGKWGSTNEGIAAFIEEKLELQRRYSTPHRAALVDRVRARGLALASHDDATVDHVDEAKAEGVVVAEFPTTPEAARAAHDAGIRVMGGAPNIVRGGSHSGNVAASDLARAGTLDVLSSDYVPAALLHAVTQLWTQGIMELPAAVRVATVNPAEAVGLTDRGALAPGRRADLVRVRMTDDQPLVRGVWVKGERVG